MVAGPRSIFLRKPPILILFNAMKLENLRSLSNDYQDMRLVSLRHWKLASEIVPRDPGGPYFVSQEGYDPEDAKMRADEFVLGRSGSWLSVGLFLKLPINQRRAEFLFASVSEVIQLLQNLPSRASTMKPAAEESLMSPGPVQDDLNETFLKARELPPGSSK